MKIFTKKIGAGHYRVDVVQNQFTNDEIENSFITVDMELLDDIHTMKNNEEESDLIMHDNFEEVKETILNLIKPTP